MSDENDTDDEYPDRLRVDEPDEFVTLTREAAGRMGGNRHILKRDSVNGDKKNTVSSLCSRKKAPTHLNPTEEAVEVLTAQEIILSDVDVCPTCEGRVNLRDYIDWTSVRQLAMRHAEAGHPDVDEFLSQEDERIPVRSEWSVEIDFPASAKYDLIEAVRELILMRDDLEADALDVDAEVVEDADPEAAEPSGLDGDTETADEEAAQD